MEDRPVWSGQNAATARLIDHLAERTLSSLEERVHVTSGRPGKARHLLVLAALGRLRALADGRIADTVAAARHDAASWTEIATALGVARQTAHERYRNRTD